MNQSDANPVSHQSGSSHLFPQPYEPAEQTYDVRNMQRNSELLCQIDSLKAKLEEALHHKNEASKELLELDQSHRKLCKENKELLKRHEQVSSELKAVKGEKEKIVKARQIKRRN